LLAKRIRNRNVRSVELSRPSSTVQGSFFFSPNLPNYTVSPSTFPSINATWSPTDQLAFQQQFPSLNFNPESGTVPGNTSGVNTFTRPLTNITTDQNGNYTGTIVAQGNGYTAGNGPLYGLKAVFTATFTVANAGQTTLNVISDDGFLLGVGNGATRVSGPMVSAPSSGVSPFGNYPLMAAYNQATGPYSSVIVINFPAPGTYPYELDYFECCAGELSVVMTTRVITPQGPITANIPPSGTLTLTPTTPSSLATGQSQTFTVLVMDASGAVVSNASIALNVSGANQRQLTATTDSTGHATFQYTGTNAGTDSVQVTANISGMGAYSNAVNMTWTVPTGGGSVVFTPQGWIGSPTIGTVVQGQVPITVASGVTLTSGTLTYWPTSNPAAVTTLNSNTTGSGTIGTFDATVLASGGYTIQLNATANGTTQVSQITVNVVGNNKPGRMTSTVTEFKVPLAGIPISITRTYDSLDRNKIEDFGFGWKLGTFVDLSVDAQNNVTFNFNGQKTTFFFTPVPASFFGIWLTPAYTPQAGVHGSLASDGCGGLLRVQSGLVCFPSTGQTYQPTVYAYTDPIGRTYTVTASGQLQSIKDLNGNTLTITPSGITSSVNGVVIPFVRDGSGRITKISDLSSPANNYTYSYDGSGNLQSVQYPGLTQAETYTYFSVQDCPLCAHLLKSEIDPRGNTSSATYYPDGRLQSISDTLTPPNTTNFSYNVSTNTTTTTFPDGGVQTRTDDSFGNPLSITDPLNRTTTYSYDSKENLVSMVDPLQNPATTYTYDANGFQTSIHDPLGHTSTKTYNSFGGVLTATDAANTNTKTTTYDASFNPIQVTDLLNGAGTQVSSSTYDSLGNLLTSTDANGKTTQYSYDPNGNLIQVTDALNQITRYGYDAMDRLIIQMDPLNNTTRFTYDALGRLKTKTDALNKTTTYNYDNNGNKTSEIDAFTPPRTTSYQYDNMNRVTKITYPDTTFKTFTYDFRGNKLTEVDQSGRTTKYVYDLAGQLTSMTYAFGTSDAGTVSYTYDLDGRQKTVKDELNNTTTNNYDAAGRLTSTQDALTHITNYGYDVDNRKTSVQDANNNTTGYAYDKRSRLTTVTYPAVPPNSATTTGYTYDGMGRVLTNTDQATKVTTKTYDAVGRLTSVKDALNNLTQYFYDADGNLRFLQDAGGRVTSYQYDALNRRNVRTLPLNQFESYTYDAVGNLATKTDFNGLKTTYAYDTLNRLLSKTPQTGTAISFTYTPTGQRLSMTDPSGTSNYSSYDNRDRLLTKATPEGTLTYTYDAHGNVLTIASSNTNGASMTYTYDALNRLASAKDNRVAAQGGSATPTTYTYDPVGNLTGYAYSNAVQTGNVFDPLNRLTQTCVATTSPACSAGTKLASYAYTLGNAGN
jgi:YD repeat-containing protein